MSNNVINMGAFKNAKPSAAFAQLNPQEENLADGIGSSYGVISYKGKVWSLRYRGEKHIFTRPDDGSPSNYIDVVILRQAHSKSKSYYPSYDQNASEGARPLCASLNGVTPDPDVQQPQATACAICPRNEFKTTADGRRTRDCTDYKRLAVLVMPMQTQALLGTPLMEPVFLRVPPASLNDLATFGETMAGQGWHFSSFVTRISFDPNLPHPKMVFTPLQALTDAEAPVVLQLREDPMAQRVVGESQNPLAERQLPPPNRAPAPMIEAKPVQQAPAPVTTGLAAPVTTGLAAPAFGVAATPAPRVVTPAPQTIDVTPQVVDDASEADAALDDRVKRLLAID